MFDDDTLLYCKILLLPHLQADGEGFGHDKREEAEEDVLRVYRTAVIDDVAVKPEDLLHDVLVIAVMQRHQRSGPDGAPSDTPQVGGVLPSEYLAAVDVAHEAHERRQGHYAQHERYHPAGYRQWFRQGRTAAVRRHHQLRGPRHVLPSAAARAYGLGGAVSHLGGQQRQGGIVVTLAARRAARLPGRVVAAHGSCEHDVKHDEHVKGEHHEYEYAKQVELLFQSENLGCGLGPATAITWFFQHVPFGIILEDDNVPSLDAFHFCEKLLPKYENDEKIMMINLTKPLKYDFSTLYTFTKYPEISGWATWARAWRNFSFDLNLKDEIKAVKPIKYFGVFEGLIRTILWKRNWKKDVKLKGKVTFWDYQWSISIFKNRGICVAPSSNMISNIGFGTGSHCPDAEHPMSSLPYETINLELKEPDVITLNTIYDKKFSKYWGKTFFYNLRKSLRRRVLK